MKKLTNSLIDVLWSIDLIPEVIEIDSWN